MNFWEFSPKGIPYRRVGKLLIAFYSPRFGSDWWDRLFVSKRQNQVSRKHQEKMYVIEKGMKIERLLQSKWHLTEDEKELIEKVNWWLKKNVKGERIHRKDFKPKRRKKDEKKVK